MYTAGSSQSAALQQSQHEAESLKWGCKKWSKDFCVLVLKKGKAYSKYVSYFINNACKSDNCLGYISLGEHKGYCLTTVVSWDIIIPIKRSILF